MAVDLDSYIFQVIDYDPTEKPRGIITADEWNTIMNLLVSSSNYVSRTLQEVFKDLYTSTELSSIVLGKDGSRLIGVDVIPGVDGTNVNEVLRNLKTQIDNVVLGALPDKSVTSEKLASNLKITGDIFTFNDAQVLTEDNLVTTLDNNSKDTDILGAHSLYTLLLNKQSLITKGTSAPTQSTPGDIYIQYIN